MGFLNFIVDVASAATKVVLTPVAVVADIATNVVTGENPGLAEGAIESAGKDLDNAMDNIID
jgi:hypothetical protein